MPPSLQNILARLETGGNIATLCDVDLELFGQRQRLIVGERSYDNVELARFSRSLASALVAKGVSPGDPVGVLLPNCVEAMIAYQAISASGATLLPLLADLSAPEVAARLKHCRAQALITTAAKRAEVRSQPDASAALGRLVVVDGGEPDSALWRLVEQHEPMAPVHRAADDLAAILYTGATTGGPKGVMLTHGNMFANVRNNAPINAAEEHIDLIVLPLTHSFGLGVWQSTYLMRGHIVLMNGGFEPERTLKLIEQHEITRMAAVPTMLISMLEHPARGRYDTSSMRVWGAGGAPIPEGQRQRFSAAFSGRVERSYGMTEAAPTITRMRHGKRSVSDSCGWPVGDVELRIIDAHGDDLDDGEVGEICVRGSNVSPGYYEMPEETERTFRDGWLHSGDLGRINVDGSLSVVGRKKEMILQSGFNVYPAEVEAALATHAAVQEVAVVGQPDELVGEAVVAFVGHGSAEVDEAQLRAHCAASLVAYKVPMRIHLAPTLPRTAIGKIDKASLRARVSEAAPNERVQLPAVGRVEAIEAHLRDVFARVLGCESVEPDDGFYELGGRSLQVTQLSAWVHERLGAKIALRTFFEASTPRLLAGRIAASLDEAQAGAAASAAGAVEVAEAGGDTDAATGADADGERYRLSGLDGAQLSQLLERFGGPDEVEDVLPLTVAQQNALERALAGQEVLDEARLRQSMLRMEMRFTGDFDADLLYTTWQRLIDVHPALRTVVVSEGLPYPVQVVLRRAEALPWRVIDMRELSPQQQAQRWGTLRGRCVPQRPPWVDAQAARDNDESVLLAVHYQMAVVDGIAMRELRQDFFRELERQLAGASADLSPRRPLRDYIAWLEANSADKSAEQYWRGRAAQARTWHPMTTPRVGGMIYRLMADDVEMIEERAQELRLPASVLALGAWALAFATHMGRDSLLLGLMDSGRNAPVSGITSTIGSFAHRVPIQISFDHALPVRQWLEQIQLQLADVQAHEHVLSQRRLRAWWGGADGHLPFDVSMNIQYELAVEHELGDRLPIDMVWLMRNHDPTWPVTPVNLSFWMYPPRDDGHAAHASLIYDSSRFDQAWVAQLTARCLSALESVLSEVDTVGELIELAISEDDE